MDCLRCWWIVFSADGLPSLLDCIRYWWIAPAADGLWSNWRRVMVMIELAKSDEPNCAKWHRLGLVSTLALPSLAALSYMTKPDRIQIMSRNIEKSAKSKLQDIKQIPISKISISTPEKIRRGNNGWIAMLPRTKKTMGALNPLECVVRDAGDGSTASCGMTGYT